MILRKKHFIAASFVNFDNLFLEKLQSTVFERVFCQKSNSKGLKKLRIFMKMYENPHPTIRWTKKYFLINVYLVFKRSQFLSCFRGRRQVLLFINHLTKRQTQVMATKQICIFYDVCMGMKVIPLSFCCKLNTSTKNHGFQFPE